MPSRSSRSDPFLAAHDAALASIARAIRRLDVDAGLIVIDGRSGGGKTTLARRLVDEWPRAGETPQLVELDSFYPGWDGLAEGTRLTHDWLLAPHAAGAVGRWRRFDWDALAFAEEHEVDPRRPLIVEGAGALTAEGAALADLTVWVEAPDDSRRRRALARDGAAYEPHWERWAAQESRHLATHDPRAIADLVVRLP